MSWLRSGGIGNAAPSGGGTSTTYKALFGLLVTMAIFLSIGGYCYLSGMQTDARATARHELSAIADLKLGQIRNWREERLADGRFFSRAHFVARDVGELLKNPESQESRSAVLQWLELLKGEERYVEAAVIDTNGADLVALRGSTQARDSSTVPAEESLFAAEAQEAGGSLLKRSLRRREVVMSDLHRDPGSGRIEIEMVSPIFEDADKAQGRVIAAVRLKMDARQFLFPLVESWPTPSLTAETLLVRKEGNDLVYLTDLRHRPNSALVFRISAASPELPAAKVLNGDTHAVVDGMDYRGVAVVAAGRLVPGTTWAMVSKMDRAEVYAPLRERMRMGVMTLGMAFAACLLSVGLLWRQKKNKFLRRELALERERADLAERLAHLLRHANDAILLVKPDGGILEANDRALNCYGYSLPEMQRMRVHDLRAEDAAPLESRKSTPANGTEAGLPRVGDIQPEQIERRADRDLEHILAEGSGVFEAVHKRKNGAGFSVEVSARKVSFGGEDLILSIIRDITERKVHEREIERLNRLYAALSHVNQSVVRLISREALFQEVCRVLVEFGGLRMAWIGWMDKPGGLLTPVAAFGNGLDLLKEAQVAADPKRSCPIAVAIRKGRPSVCNDMAGNPDCVLWKPGISRYGWASMAAVPIRQEGTVRGTLAVYAGQKGFFGKQEESLIAEVAADVVFGLEVLSGEQRRKEAEDRLESQAAALRSAANSIVIAGVDGNIRWVNPAFERLTGYSAAEVIGQNPRLLNSGKQDREFFKQMWEVVLKGHVWHGEVINKRKDGALYTEEMTITPVEDSAGRISEFVAIKQDVTARRQSEEALRQARDELARANAELEYRVQERTAQLRESMAELEAFSYSLSHDLRSPLRTIRAFTSIVLEDQSEKLGGEATGMLKSVVAASMRMDQLVSDVLALSRVSRGQIVIEALDLEKLVRQIVQERSELRPPRAEIQIQSPMGRVLGNEASMIQCLTNLLGNAVKFVAPGVTPQVQVFTERSPGRVRLWVRDNGIGIPPQAREKIFEVFQRLHGQDAYEGTGIGLAIVKKAVERMGGHVGVESEVGKGSRFWVELSEADESGTPSNPGAIGGAVGAAER